MKKFLSMFFAILLALGFSVGSLALVNNKTDWLKKDTTNEVAEQEVVVEQFDCTKNPLYASNGGVNLYSSSEDNVCIIKIFVELKGINAEYDEFIIATLPEGFNANFESFGTIVSQADSTAPNQSFVVSVKNNEIKLLTKGVVLESGWVLGSITFINAHNN